MRVLELFAGIGGLSACWAEADVVAAVDINRSASEIYRDNFSSPYIVREIATMSTSELRGFQANVWWMSPPCQPFTRRGNQQDWDDARSGAFRFLVQQIDLLLPDTIALENVVGFQDSVAYARLVDCLRRTGYRMIERVLCPTELGWPNRRPRFYLVASRSALGDWRPLPVAQLLQKPSGFRNFQLLDRGSSAPTLREFLESPRDQEASWLDDATVARFHDGLDRVEADDPTAVTACFAGSYGKTILRSGSYLKSDGRYRRFTPREVARLLGFSHHFRLKNALKASESQSSAEDCNSASYTTAKQTSLPLSQRQTWKLLGNSLSLPAVLYVVSHIPGGPDWQ